MATLYIDVCRKGGDDVTAIKDIKVKGGSSAIKEELK